MNYKNHFKRNKRNRQKMKDRKSRQNSIYPKNFNYEIFFEPSYLPIEIWTHIMMFVLGMDSSNDLSKINSKLGIKPEENINLYGLICKSIFTNRTFVILSKKKFMLKNKFWNKFVDKETDP